MKWTDFITEEVFQFAGECYCTECSQCGLIYNTSNRTKADLNWLKEAITKEQWQVVDNKICCGRCAKEEAK